MSNDFQVKGKSALALFDLKIHRGDGMALIAMNWKAGTPPRDFVGFAIEYKEPDGDRYFALKNRLAFPSLDGELNPNALSTKLSPIQKFRWVHFPRNAELVGDFHYRVTPVFMNIAGELSYGDPQEAAIQLSRRTYPTLNVAFTRGFVSSQAFVDRYEKLGPIKEILPSSAKDGLGFEPTHPKAAEALAWMGFEARSAILEVLDKAIAQGAGDVRVVAYDLNLPEIGCRDARRRTDRGVLGTIRGNRQPRPPPMDCSCRVERWTRSARSESDRSICVVLRSGIREYEITHRSTCPGALSRSGPMVSPERGRRPG